MGNDLVKFGKHDLSTPNIFASYRLGDYPSSGLCFNPWEMTNTQALLVNAYDFQRPKYKQLLEADWNIEEYLSFRNKPILIDSGAYYFRKQKTIRVSAEDVFDIQCKSKAHVGVALDHPFPPTATDKAHRIHTTRKNTRAALRKLTANTDDANLIDFMPVVHGHTSHMVKAVIGRLRSDYEFYGIKQIDRVGIGSVAPLAQNGNTTLIVDVINSVRNNAPDAHIHCFSMGSALLMLLAFYCGADTVDSQSWIVSAGFKYAQLPGNHLVRVGRRDYKSDDDFKLSLNAFGERIQLLAKEEGFFVKDWRTGDRLDCSCKTTIDQYVNGLVDRISNENVHNRACHNLWSYNFEASQARKAKREGKLDAFIETRLNSTKYKFAIEYAKSKR